MRFCGTALISLLCSAGIVLSQTLPPSPTASIGCEPHDDHWHCEGPRPTSAPAVSTPAPPTMSSSAPPASSAVLAPSPTASVGCKPHGDHWHCDGPASATSTSARPSASAGSNSTVPGSSPPPTFSGAASHLDAVGAIAAVGMAALALL